MGERIALETVPSPLGAVLLATRAAALVAIDFADCETRMRRLLARRFGEFELARARARVSTLRDAIRAYFDGEIGVLDTLAADPGGTPFQADVWRELRRIPAGTTCTYAELAERVGRPGAARAAGRANGLNPIALVIPCHRVIGANGALTGYAGGLARKRWLLEHEASHAAARR